MKRIVKVVALVLLCMVLILPTSALETLGSINQPTDLIDSPETVINMYRTCEDTDYSIRKQYTLFSFSGTPDYTLYILNPYGYAILLNETNGLLEACYLEDADLCIDVENNRQYYYGGPGVYCTYEKGEFINHFDKRVISDADVSVLTERELDVKAYETNKAQILATGSSGNNERGNSTRTVTETFYAGYAYFSTLSNYGRNVNGTCTVIATQMLLGYYDYYANDSFVATTYEQNNGTTETFHQILNNYVYGTSQQGGIFIHNAAPGINDYLQDRGLLCSLNSVYSSQNAVIGKIQETLQNGEPLIASMGTHCNALYNHTVLIYGVTYDSGNPIGTAVVTMHMGWQSTSVDGQSTKQYVASAGWFYECGYIQSNCTLHTMTAWQNKDAIYHWRGCRKCTHFEEGKHSDSWNSVLAKCTKCGRTGAGGLEG